jgi:hypothetical protein
VADANITILNSAGVAVPVDSFTQANGDHRQAFVIGDATNPYTGAVDAFGRQQINVGGSSSMIPPITQTLTAAAASTISGTASTNGAAVADVSQAGNISFHLLASAFVGTLAFEQSFDPAGTAGTWVAVPVLPEDAASQPITSLAINTAVSYIRQFTLPAFGPSLFRVRVNTFTSGSIIAFVKPGPGWYEGQPALAPSTANIGIVDLGAATNGTTFSVTLSGTANTNTSPVAADATRKGMLLTNNNASAVILLNFGSTATTTTLFSIRMPPGTAYEVPGWASKLAVQAQANVASATLIVGPGTGI